MSILPLTIPPKRLAQSVAVNGTTFKLNNIRGWDAEDLAPGDFGTEAYGVFINSTRTQIEIFKFDPATIADDSITILVRGLGYTGGDIEIPANKFAWPSNDTLVQLGTDAPQLFRDFMSSSNPATITELHEYDVLPQSSVAPTDAEDFVNKEYVDAKTGSALAVEVEQVAHGFVVGDIIRVDGVNTYAKAQADSAANAEVVGIVRAVENLDNFEFTTEGVVTTGVPAETAGTVLFLSPTVAGALTATAPTTIGHVSVPLAVVQESGVSMVFHKFRGAVLNTIAGNPIASETVAGIVEQATPAQVVAGTDTGETGAPLFVVPSLMTKKASEKVLTVIPRAIIADGVDGVLANASVMRTSFRAALVHIDSPIDVNYISVIISNVTTPGTMDVSLFSEDGQTRLFKQEINGGTIGVNTLQLADTVPLIAGKYWLGANATSSGNFTFIVSVASTYFNAASELGGGVAGKVKLMATMEIAEDATPTQLDLSSFVFIDRAGPIIRFDN